MINFDERLRKLKDRRQGTREQNITERVAADSSTFNYRDKKYEIFSRHLNLSKIK